MSPTRKITTYLSALFILLLSGCVNDTPKSLRIPNGVDLKDKVFFNPYNVPFLFNINNTFAFVMDNSTIDLIEAKKMTMTSFGGKNPTDILEKFEFNFNKEGKIQSYNLKKAPYPNKLFTDVHYVYEKGELAKLNYDVYMGKKSDAHTKFVRSNDKLSLIIHRNKTENNLDIYENNGQMSLSVDRIGDKIFSITYYVPTGVSLKNYIVEQNKKLEFDQDAIEKCLKYVIYVVNDLPQVGYILGQNYTQEGRVQQFDYDENNRISKFQQWIGNDKITEIVFIYGKDYLPESILNNNLKYKIEFD